jgi:hypothetical protein
MSLNYRLHDELLTQNQTHALLAAIQTIHIVVGVQPFELIVL